jgi:HEAT repeat protein
MICRRRNSIVGVNSLGVSNRAFGDIRNDLGSIMRSNLLAILMIAYLVGFAAPIAAGGTVPSATLSIAAEHIQPTDMPIVIILTIKNTGPVPIAYWCGGPGEYPDAKDYCAKLRSIDGAESGSNVMRLFNGQQSDGAGRLHPIAAGEVARMPAVLEPLPIGKYQVIAGCRAYGHVEHSTLRTIEWPAQLTVQPVEIEIRDDPTLRDQRDKQLLSSVRAADPFSHWVAADYPRRAVHAALSEDLMSPNVIVAERAMDGLWGAGAPSETDAPLVLKAIQTHLKPPADGIDYGMMGRLLSAASHDPSPAAQEMVVKATAARPDGKVHELAVRTLEKMRSPVTARRWPPTPPPQDQYDQDAITALIKLLGSQSVSERQLACRLLAAYPKSPQAADALVAAAKDVDPSVRSAAHDALAAFIR